ncbi:MAG TPA: RIP metalloprotease, partial [Alphaproteobacteria bacterium]|nr:RIP metalloprotease [Alphaproteobacteria bacterium]
MAEVAEMRDRRRRVSRPRRTRGRATRSTTRTARLSTRDPDLASRAGGAGAASEVNCSAGPEVRGASSKEAEVWTALIVIVLVANLLIFVHELGHLLAAKWAGMPVTCFSVGFGPSLAAKQVGRTRYQLALIPLGGYVRIEGMRGTDEERRAWPTGFAFQPLHARMVVIAAGCAANVILAGLLYAALALDGGGAPGGDHDHAGVQRLKR